MDKKDTTESYSLLIWQQFGEEAIMYLIPNKDISDEMRQYLIETHGSYLNIDDSTEALETLNNAISENSDNCFSTEDNEKYNCIWHQYKLEIVKNNPFNNINITHVYESGFAL